MNKTIALTLSLVLNVVLGMVLFIGWFNAPSGKLGVLQRDVVAKSKDPKVPFEIRLPRGLTVRNEDPRGISGIGMFEPYRFAVVLTTDYSDLVRYGPPKRQVNQYGELYSIVSPEWPPSK